MPAVETDYRDPQKSLLRKALLTAGLLTSVLAVGVVGLRWVTGADWFDCLYLAVITLTTVGYGEVIELGTPGRMFLIVYLIMSFGVFTYSAFQIGHWLMNAEFQRLLEKRRMERALRELNDHYIVCGQGRMGTTICRHLEQHGKKFVVVDSAEERLRATAAPQGWLFIVGDATDDGVLKHAGIERAKSLAAVLPTDADNIYVVLSARLLSSKLEIIARASSDKAVSKMERAGADRVVSPYSTGAVKMAKFMLNPNVEDFLEVADHKGNNFELADIEISADSPYVGQTLAQTKLRESGVIVVGIRRANGERLLPPAATDVIRAGDCLFAFGSSTAVNQMIGNDA